MSNSATSDTQLVLWRYSNPYVDPFSMPVREFLFRSHYVKIRQNTRRGERPLGSVIWDCAYLMCKYLEHIAEDLKDKNIIELGSGTGLVGIVAALLGARTTLTDRNEVLDLLRANVTTNLNENSRSRCSVKELVWGSDLSAYTGVTFDYILCSDVVYGEYDFDLLVRSLRDLSTPGYTRTLLAYKPRYRDKEAAFFHSAALSFDIEQLPQTKLPEEFQHHSIELYILVRKK